MKIDRKIIKFKYYSLKMLDTIDINSLFSILIKKYGKKFLIDVSEMCENDKEKCTAVCTGLSQVNDLFLIYEEKDDGSFKRRNDIELEAIEMGQK